MLGSAEKAKVFLDELAQFAAKTPFTLTGVEQSAKQLMAVGFEAEEVLPALKAVGDMAAGLGLRQDGLQRLILNLGQVKTLGKLSGRELLDFTRNTVPIYEMLADQMGVTKDKIADMTSAGKISADDVVAAFKKMTSAGGKFENMMIKMAKTTGGRIQELGDQIEILSREMGNELLPIVSDVVEVFIDLVDWFDKLEPSTRTLIVAIGGAVTIVTLLAGAILLVTGAVILAIPVLTALGITMATFFPILFVGMGIIAALTAVIYGWTAASKENTRATNVKADAKENLADKTDEMTEAAGGLPQGFKDANAELEKFIDLMDSILPLSDEELESKKKEVEQLERINNLELERKAFLEGTSDISLLPIMEEYNTATKGGITLNKELFDNLIELEKSKLEKIKENNRIEFNDKRDYLAKFEGLKLAGDEMDKRMHDDKIARLVIEEQKVIDIIKLSEHVGTCNG